MTDRRRLLLLGGTQDAVALARRLIGEPRIDLIVSLAGRTKQANAQPGRLRIGGFGDVEGLAAYLQAESIDLVVDATHPYAARMPHNAAEACDQRGVPRLRLLRPPWQKQEADYWIEVPDGPAAARALSDLAKRVFLTTGHQGMVAFAACPDIRFLVRLIDPPKDPLPLANYELILARGPFATTDEIDLCQSHEIQALVTKNSGGDATYGKIEAARALGLPVVMIARPEGPSGETCDSSDAAELWVRAKLAPA